MVRSCEFMRRTRPPIDISETIEDYRRKIWPRLGHTCWPRPLTATSARETAWDTHQLTSAPPDRRYTGPQHACAVWSHVRPGETCYTSFSISSDSALSLCSVFSFLILIIHPFSSSVAPYFYTRFKKIDRVGSMRSIFNTVMRCTGRQKISKADII